MKKGQFYAELKELNPLHEHFHDDVMWLISKLENQYAKGYLTLFWERVEEDYEIKKENLQESENWKIWS